MTTIESQLFADILEKVDNRYREDLARYLEQAQQNESWLRSFPQEQEWMLSYSESDAWKALAAQEGKEYVANRVEDPPTKAQEFLELAQRRHTAADALETKILRWGSGTSRIQGVEVSSQAILTSMQEATPRLTDLLLVTDPDKEIVHLNFQGKEVRRLTALDVLKEIADHEKRHHDLGRILFDGAQARFPSTYRFAMPQTPK